MPVGAPLRPLHLLNPRAARPGRRLLQLHGGKIVTVARFIAVLRQLNRILSGIIGMRWAKFLAFNALGAVLWVGTWAGLGYLAGEHIVSIYSAIERYKWYAFAAVAVIAAALITHRIRARRRDTARKTN